ncbi:hypothetical protein PACTADRAFT_2776 [Pachysolen tannophilus NRRL Y-2460]|uniref:Uncharacterized protein n=1 Tax=Pachysolen tannophilus NRRL Y-2460 TaxID=669874 RepID=A0A1E4TXG6_PACTA|nr:hypothetical protein PACTADRAFT_2776 [Pachysolen tannophilus NRRL Y-2460]
MIEDMKRKKNPTNNDKQLVTADDFSDEAIQDEDSGDRWFSSDLTKSLRFYQKAYEHYDDSVRASNDDLSKLDTYYNIARLLFHVYNNFVRPDCIMLVDPFSNVADCLNSENGVVKDLDFIIKYHEFALGKFNELNKNSFDLIYNTALIYLEFIEDQDINKDVDFDFEDLIRIGLNSANLFTRHLEHLILELNELIQNFNFNQPQSPSEENSTVSKDQSQSFEEQEIITPSVALETIITSYKLLQSLYELVTNGPQLEYLNSRFNNFLNFLDNSSLSLMKNFGLLSPTNGVFDHLSDEDINNLKIAKKSLLSSMNDDINEIVKIWEENEQIEIPEYYMSYGDSLQNFLDKISTSSNLTISNQELWNLYSKMLNIYKKSQLLVDAKYQISKTKEVASSLIYFLGSLMIKRADLEILRVSLENIELSDQNRQILIKNAKNLLKSAVNITNLSSVGLRENIFDKLNRFKKRNESTLRLYILEGKTSNQELDKVFNNNRNSWVFIINMI